MRCTYSSLTCPAGNGTPGHHGGDIVATVETPAVARLMVGDVMGHGPEAIQIAARVTSAFTRLAAHAEDPPQVVAARLDHLVATLDEAGAEHREEFVTAQFIDIPRDGSGARIVCCGHPPPLLLRDGAATFLDAIPPAPPLGLLDLAGSAFPHPVPLGERPGDTVLFYTDGVTEARAGGDAGAVYPFPDRAAALAGDFPEEGARGYLPRQVTPRKNLVEALAADLLAYVGGALRDDATLMSLRMTESGIRQPEAEQGPRSIFLGAE